MCTDKMFAGHVMGRTLPCVAIKVMASSCMYFLQTEKFGAQYFVKAVYFSTSIVSACCRQLVPPSPSFRMQVFFFFSVDYWSVFCCRIHHSLQTLSLHSCPLINDQGIKHIACKCHLPLLLCVCVCI